MLERFLRKYLDRVTYPLVRALAAAGVSPVVVSVAGVVFAACAASLIVAGRTWPAGVLVVLSGLCDALDGTLARRAGRASVRGAFLDSTLDRIGETVLLLAFVWRFAYGRPVVALLAASLLAASMLFSYMRARAESLGLSGSAGFAARPERVVLLTVVSTFPSLALPAFSVALVVVVLSAIQRFNGVRAETARPPVGNERDG